MRTQPHASLLDRAFRRVGSIKKGRSLPTLSRDVFRIWRKTGARGLFYRTSFEITHALAPPPPPLPPPPDPEPPLPPPPHGIRLQTHAFHVASHDFFNPSLQEREENRNVTSRFASRSTSITSATWFVPYFNHTYFGGIYTILRFMNWMAVTHATRHRLVLFDSTSITDRELRADISGVFPALRDIDIVIPPTGRIPFMDYEELPFTDIAVCTIWHSAYALLRFNATNAKYYFVQDFEPSFYPAGSLYALSEATYRFGFAGIVNTPGLNTVYEGYGNLSVGFVPAVDTFEPDLSKPSMLGSPVQIVVYGRPGTDRNAFELLATASRKLKSRFGPAISIISAGEDWDPRDFDLDGIIENRGLLRSREEIHRLYLKSDIGLFCMLSKHPSYQPFEYLAAGMAVVTNINTASEWFLQDRQNCLTSEPIPAALADAVAELVSDRELRLKLASNGATHVGAVSWGEEFEKVWRFMTSASIEAPDKSAG